MFLRISLCVIILIISVALGDSQYRPRLNSWEEVCLSEHNKLRVPHALQPVVWDYFMHSVANFKALNLLVKDQNWDFAVPGLKEEVLASEYISFNYEITTKKPMENKTESEMENFLVSTTNEMIRSWYNKYFLSPNSENNEILDRILDPTTKKMGCSVHALTEDSGKVKIYLTVAYQKDKELMAKFKANQIRGRGADSKDAPRSAGRTCTSNCTSFGSCYSHRASEGFVRSRVGTGTTFGRSRVGVVRENCRCEPDPELVSDSYLFNVPHCEGPCFVSCPLASESAKKSCQGITKCTCKYGKGGAHCE